MKTIIGTVDHVSHASYLDYALQELFPVKLGFEAEDSQDENDEIGLIDPHDLAYHLSVVQADREEKNKNRGNR